MLSTNYDFSATIWNWIVSSYSLWKSWLSRVAFKLWSSRMWEVTVELLLNIQIFCREICQSECVMLFYQTYWGFALVCLFTFLAFHCATKMLEMCTWKAFCNIWWKLFIIYLGKKERKNSWKGNIMYKRKIFQGYKEY